MNLIDIATQLSDTLLRECACQLVRIQPHWVVAQLEHAKDSMCDRVILISHVLHIS